MTYWTNPQCVGYLPQIFLEDDPHTAQEQANTNYAHGGGWVSFMNKGFQLAGSADKKFYLTYPGDPKTHELSRTTFHNQLLVMFEHSWVGIIEADNTLSDIARID